MEIKVILIEILGTARIYHPFLLVVKIKLTSHLFLIFLPFAKSLNPD